MNKEDVYSVIKLSIANNRAGVVDALNKSLVKINTETRDDELFYIIEREILNGNGFLVYHLEDVIKDASRDSASNFSNTTSSASGDAWLGAVTAVIPLVGGLFGGGKNNSASNQQAQAALNQQQMMMQYQMAQQAAENAKAQQVAEQQARDAAARRSNNMMIFGIIGGIIVFGGIMAIVLTRGKSKIKA